MMKILFTPSARKQFLDALNYIKKDNPRAAKDFKNKAERILLRLLDFPDSGRKIPEFPEIPFREVIVRPYRFFYRVEGQIVWIASVWHGAQIPESPED